MLSRVGYRVPALLACAVCAGCLGALLHGCTCGPIDAYGIHDGAEVQTTVVGRSPPDVSEHPCTGLDDWPSGTTLAWNARVVASGEGPGCATGWLRAMTLDSVNGQAVAAGPGGFVDAGSGCEGSLSLGIQADPQRSIFDPSPDGGPAAWILLRQFVPALMDGGACPLPAGQCVDRFVVWSKKL